MISADFIGGTFQILHLCTATTRREGDNFLNRTLPPLFKPRNYPTPRQKTMADAPVRSPGPPVLLHGITEQQLLPSPLEERRARARAGGRAAAATPRGALLDE